MSCSKNIDFHRRALEHARADIGKGEIKSNNEGPYVRSLMLPFKHRTAGPWCAAAVSAWFMRAADEMNTKLPFKPWPGARTLGNRIAAVGRWISESDQIMPGDVVVWYRGLMSGRKGHIGLVDYVHTRGTVDRFITIEGNYGRFPAKVDTFWHSRDEKKLIGFCRLW